MNWLYIIVPLAILDFLIFVYFGFWIWNHLVEPYEREEKYHDKS